MKSQLVIRHLTRWMLSTLLAGLLLAQPLQAQTFPVDGSINVNIPGFKYATQGTQFGITTDVDKILKAQANEYMQGLLDYAVEIQDLMISIAKDKLIEAAAEAAGDILPFGGGTVASEILSAYQKSKDESLANEIDKVKAVVRDGMNREIKIAYQKYKLKYAKFVANSKAPNSIKNSDRKKQATEDIASMYPWEVAAIDQVYQGNNNGQVSQVEQWTNSIYPDVNQFNMTAYTIGKSYDIIADKSLKVKMDMTDQEFDPASAMATEVSSMRPFDRIRLRQEITAAVLKKKAMLKAIVDNINSSNGVSRKKNMREGFSEMQPLPSIHK